MDLAPEEHVKVQGAFQRWIDSAISKTCNVPNDYTVEQVSELFQYMYELGCKGGTIYRDGSRDEQVLMLKGDERAESEMEEMKSVASAESAEPATTPHRVYPRPGPSGRHVGEDADAFRQGVYHHQSKTSTAILLKNSSLLARLAATSKPMPRAWDG